MWLNVMHDTETPVNMPDALLSSRPGQIVFMEAPHLSSKHRVIELLTIDIEDRNVRVIDNALSVPWSLPEKDTLEEDVIVMYDVDLWPQSQQLQSELATWVGTAKLRHTVIITGEELRASMSEMMGKLLHDYTHDCVFYWYKSMDSSTVNINPWPLIRRGSIIRMGTFPFNVTGAGLPMLWRVIHRHSYVVYLLAENPVRFCSYCPPGAEISWRHSPLRIWLNDTFLNTCFSEEENNTIMSIRTEGTDPDISGYESPGVPGKIALASVHEVDALVDNEDRKLYAPTQTFDAAKGSTCPFRRSVDWWLRVRGENEDTIAYVTADGVIDKAGRKAIDCCAVRPMMLVNLNRLPERIATEDISSLRFDYLQ